jgi:peptidoglycan/xylan/chitin deacetylase (PgdA/CDA1 family)
MNSHKPTASLSLDLDNQWSYLKTHGDKGWESFPSYLDVLVPRVLDFLQKRSLQITFFVVGQDAALEKNQEALSSISARGHEIGNHSFSHEPWLHLYDAQRVEQEIRSAEEYLEKVTGQRTIGFRGPGFSFTDETRRVLEQRGYLYDASTFPTFLGPLARIYYFFHSNLVGRDKKQRKALFGSISNGFRPLKPYRWNGKNGLLEIPVSTMPIFRIPIHLSYILYLSEFSSGLAALYFGIAMRLCKLTGVSPSLLLHPLDFLGCDDKIGLDFFPGMGLPAARKIEIVGRILDIYSNHFNVVCMKDHALGVAESLPTRDSAKSFAQNETRNREMSFND